MCKGAPSACLSGVVSSVQALRLAPWVPTVMCRRFCLLLPRSFVPTAPVVFALSTVIRTAQHHRHALHLGHACGENRRIGEAGMGVWGKTWNRAVVLRGRGVPGFPQCVSGLIPPPDCYSCSRAVVFLTSPSCSLRE